jgi:heat shock protein HslJ
MKRISIALIVSMIMAIMSSCTGSDLAGQANLEGINWVLTSYDKKARIDGTLVFLQFTNGKISGNAGCNHYEGSYQVTGKAISFRDIFTTEMFCSDPQGIMDQEVAYLEVLRSAAKYNISDAALTISNDNDQTLIFEKQQASATPLSEASSTITSTPIVDDRTPTSAPLISSPAGFKDYQDKLVNISIYIPETWEVTGIVDGQYAIFQSFPIDKYAGGEVIDPGDTKCDLNILSPDVNMTSYSQQLKASSAVSIISEEEITLQSGLKAKRFEIDNMGRSILFITDLNDRAIVLTCFGDFTLVDKIANTLHAGEMK